MSDFYERLKSNRIYTIDEIEELFNVSSHVLK